MDSDRLFWYSLRNICERIVDNITDMDKAGNVDEGEDNVDGFVYNHDALTYLIRIGEDFECLKHMLDVLDKSRLLADL